MEHLEIPAERLSAKISWRCCSSHFGEAKLARGGKPAMACNDVTFASNQNGVRTPKCSDASGDFRDLSVGVRK
jgi:hypothetical protein